mmetsp:Transcript_32302/g.89219  ORF Transcript_32302/g.89219 Transcript_32302/m.89219 type:complete len:526 (-) Transcript_32302:115-1692(-)
MPDAADVLGFDLYDECWRDCWLAATSAARLRKKQVDLDIKRRVARLLEDYGPQSEKPLTLRIYGTMIKGFCVINNERARALFCDCERVVLMFARQPFTEAADSAIRLPAAKRPRIEAALTLDIDLARVEASEAFDWTQAPLEEGALLRLGGGMLPQDQALPPSLELLGGDLLAPPGGAFAASALAAAPGLEAGWLPKFEEAPIIGDANGQVQVNFNPEAREAEQPVAPQAQNDPMASQLAVLEVASGPPAAMIPPGQEAAAAPQAPGAWTSAPHGQDIAMRPPRRRQEPLIKPGTVYGFDEEPIMPGEGYERWQHDAQEITLPRVRPTGYAQEMDDITAQSEHFGPWFRRFLEPPVGAVEGRAAPAFAGVGGRESSGSHAAPPVAAAETAQVQNVEQAQEFVAGGPAQDTMALVPHEGTDAGLAQAAAVPAAASSAAVMDVDFNARGTGAEAQDDKTAEVGEIIRTCLQGSGAPFANFHDLVPPSAADRATAACTFSALLHLASAGEFSVTQETPYGSIGITICA